MAVCTELQRILLSTAITTHSGAKCLQRPDGDENEKLNFTNRIVPYLFEPLTFTNQEFTLKTCPNGNTSYLNPVDS